MTTVLFIAMAVYGSLVPFRFVPISIHEAATAFSKLPFDRLQIGSRTDFLSNVLLFVPIGFCLAGSILADRRGLVIHLLAPFVVLPLLAISSGLIEFAQFWTPARSPSAADVQAQIIGSAIGLFLWYVFGKSITAILRGALAARSTSSLLDHLVVLYALGLIVESFLPFDFTIRLSELLEKWQYGRVNLVPFADVRWSLAAVFGLAARMLSFAPIGWLISSIGADRLSTSNRIVLTAASGLLFTGLLELAQLLVLSRFSSTTDVVVGTAGVLAGELAGSALRRDERRGVHVRTDAAVSPLVWLPGLVYALFLAARYWSPFDFVSDMAVIKERIKGMIRTPFAAMQMGNPLSGLYEIVTKPLWFFPLGLALAYAATRSIRGRAARRLAIALLTLSILGFAATIEIGQVFLASRTPDVTDVLLYTAGGFAGLLLGSRGNAGEAPS